MDEEHEEGNQPTGRTNIDDQKLQGTLSRIDEQWGNHKEVDLYCNL